MVAVTPSGKSLGARITDIDLAEPSGFVGTVPEAIDLIGQYRDTGIALLIVSNLRNDDAETRELLVSEIMPHFA